MNITRTDNSVNFSAKLEPSFWTSVPKALKDQIIQAGEKLENEGSSTDVCIMRKFRELKEGGWSFLRKVKLKGETRKSSFPVVLNGTPEDNIYSIVKTFKELLP